jgi:hypothetical protein
MENTENVEQTQDTVLICLYDKDDEMLEVLQRRIITIWDEYTVEMLRNDCNYYRNKFKGNLRDGQFVCYEIEDAI